MNKLKRVNVISNKWDVVEARSLGQFIVADDLILNLDEYYNKHNGKLTVKEKQLLLTVKRWVE